MNAIAIIYTKIMQQVRLGNPVGDLRIQKIRTRISRPRLIHELKRENLYDKIHSNILHKINNYIHTTLSVT